MYSPLNLHQLATEEYNRALRMAERRRLAAFVLRKQNDLLSLESILNQCKLIGQRSLGLCTVAMEQIVGSAGRIGDFDITFLPRRPITKDRWVHILKALY